MGVLGIRTSLTQDTTLVVSCVYYPKRGCLVNRKPRSSVGSRLQGASKQDLTGCGGLTRPPSPILSPWTNLKIELGKRRGKTTPSGHMTARGIEAYILTFGCLVARRIARVSLRQHTRLSAPDRVSPPDPLRFSGRLYGALALWSLPATVRRAN